MSDNIMHIPSSTYRIQFNKDFTFKNLLEILPYLESLGISTIYASPILHSTPGSMHGYDVTDPHSIDPEIGTEAELYKLAAELQIRKMAWIQDIVPNHMAFSPDNHRLMDVLERREDSPYYEYFDIDWHHQTTSLTGKVMIPILGNILDDCVANGEVKIVLSQHGVFVNYFENFYPLSIPGYEMLIHADASQTIRLVLKEFIKMSTAYEDLEGWENYKRNFFDGFGFKDVLQQVLDGINSNPRMLMDVLATQFYRLQFWKISEQEINYRRFFTVNSLICLQMERDDVFNDYHKYLKTLWEAKIIQGFRIDHIDGLNNPTAYIGKLRKLFGSDAYIIAEKILEGNEALPQHWDIEGTSGYEFLAHVSQLFTDRHGARQILGFYHTLVPHISTYRELVSQNKQLILEKHMGGEWDNLVSHFFLLDLQSDFKRERIKTALGILMMSLPVYRIYPETLPLALDDRRYIEEAFVAASSVVSDVSNELDYLRSLFLSDTENADERRRIVTFLRRMMQFTGPLTAKGVEDTTFYIYSPLLSHDEVGDSPSTLGISIQKFHEKMHARQRFTPLSLNATATHDTKRGEDSRLRLNIISELPEEWQQKVAEWLSLTKKYQIIVDGKEAPDVNECYFIFQSLVGGFPETFEVTEEFISRLKAYMTKVGREAKVNTSWEKPNEAYENACAEFIQRILNDEAFLSSFISFQKIITKYSNVYALGQTLIKMTAPGIPDFYQGNTLWDLSFVDPDNRRAVDYSIRQNYLQQIANLELENKEDLWKYLHKECGTGLQKMFLTWKTLHFRKENNDVFVHGAYLPLMLFGSERSAIAYMRHHEKKWVLVVAALNVVRFLDRWDAMAVMLPDHAPRHWRNILTGENLLIDRQFSLTAAFSKFPVALLVSE
ncbi:malto-oligosyltrehalose synthase [Pseudochryseolinea flava]|uniref:Malto-oligosyltrehalose synthase n=1 Tax=Pseudochryseolinea flava TaxID=2059302 RepID=A0A364Y2C9_9BACT|nr:malto-oligosyltrehalose synthase [Pseudochryseolinea flava]RAW00930.1 malto-oligosyltrehalose synthase [Pseudochryseolinea flava]